MGKEKVLDVYAVRIFSATGRFPDEGCCTPAAQNCPFSNCGAATPYNVYANLTVNYASCVEGNDTWFGCQYLGSARIYTDMDFDAYLTDNHTLSQIAHCGWEKEIEIDETLYSICYEGPAPDCSSCCEGWTSHSVTKIRIRASRFSALVSFTIELLTSTWGWLPVATGAAAPDTGECTDSTITLSGDSQGAEFITSGTAILTS